MPQVKFRKERFFEDDPDAFEVVFKADDNLAETIANATVVDAADALRADNAGDAGEAGRTEDPFDRTDDSESHSQLVWNVFCAGGPGSGVDPTCSPGGGKGGASAPRGFFARVLAAFGFGPKTPTMPPNLSTFDGKLADAMTRPKLGPNGLPMVSIDGKNYIVKPAARFSESEVMGSEFSAEAGVDVVPVHVATINGRQVSATEVIPGSIVPSSTTKRAGGGRARQVTYTTVDTTQGRGDGMAPTIAKMTDADKVRALATVPRAQIERHALYDYAIGYADSHEGQYIIAGGRLHGLDKDPSFAGEGGKGDSARFRSPIHLERLGGADFTFSRVSIDHMASAADRIAGRLESSGRGHHAVGVRTRAAVLRKLIELHGDTPTLGQLETLGTGFHLMYGRG